MEAKKPNGGKQNERYFNETVTGSRCSFRTSNKKMGSKMAEYIFQARNGIHIIDLQKTSKKYRGQSSDTVKAKDDSVRKFTHCFSVAGRLNLHYNRL